MATYQNLSSKKSGLTPQVILQAYSMGIFPMARSRSDSEIMWIDPDRRGIIPLDGLRISRSLRKSIRNNRLEIRYNTDFQSVILACAKKTKSRQDTWINDEIISLYSDLYTQGFVKTVECWLDESLVGGLYGIALKGAFFGESMFSIKQNASKIALFHLVDQLNEGGFVLLDTQFVTDHLIRLGAIEVSRAEYHTLLEKALLIDAKFNSVQTY